MRSTFLGLETARKGLSASQKGLDITGHNISNVNTDGYTRQRVDFVSVSNEGHPYRTNDGKISQAGQGVQMQGVSQIRDKFLDKRYRDEYANTSYYETAKNILTALQDSFDEVSSENLNAKFEALLESLQNWSNNPNEEIYASIVKSATSNVNQTIKQFHKQLTDVADQQIYDTQVLVNSTNTCLQKIVDINRAILLENTNELNEMYTSNELQDSRNLLLDELAGYGDINVTYETDGTTTVTMNGHTVIDGTWCESINLYTYNDKTIGMKWQSTGDNIILESGSLRANMDYVNGNTGDVRGIQYYLGVMDGFANKFAEIMNTSIKEYVYDETGKQIYVKPDGTETTTPDLANGDVPKTQFKTLIAPDDGGDVIMAGNINIAKEWNANPGYAITDVQTDGVEGNLVTTDILRLINNLSSSVKIGSYEGTLTDFITTYNTDVGTDIVYMGSRYDASDIITTDLANRRDAVSGVSLDEEGANLMMFEKAYNAVARVMTAMDEALDKLINGTGLVGR